MPPRVPYVRRKAGIESITTRMTTFAHAYLQQLGRFAQAVNVPRVRALHLPPQPPPAQGPDNRGEFCAVELEDGALGMSYALFDGVLARLHAQAGTPGLVGADALALAQGYARGDAMARALGFAAANALTCSLYQRAGYCPPASTDSIGELDPQPGDAIGMIGLFTSLLSPILDRGAKITVVELRPELAGAHPGYTVTTDRNALRTCNKVVSTGTILLNNTLDAMLEVCGNARRLALIGPTAACLPDALFARGVTLLGSSWVRDAPGFTAALREGRSRSGTTIKTAITPATYPGFDALLQAAYRT
jgi:uncharacterized protein (DUF4213/DUF364 family)